MESIPCRVNVGENQSSMIEENSQPGRCQERSLELASYCGRHGDAETQAGRPGFCPREFDAEDFAVGVSLRPSYFSIPQFLEQACMLLWRQFSAVTFRIRVFSQTISSRAVRRLLFKRKALSERRKMRLAPLNRR